MTYIKRNRVTLTCRRIPPAHNDVKAVYFDRGTYVRERELFKHIFRRAYFFSFDVSARASAVIQRKRQNKQNTRINRRGGYVVGNVKVETAATARVYAEGETSEKCAVCGKKSKHTIIFARAY